MKKNKCNIIFVVKNKMKWINGITVFVKKKIESHKAKRFVTKQRKEAKRSVLFNNSPISNSKEDAFDFDIKVKALKKAIDEKSTIIALIGGYGAGKSSLTKLLYKKYHFWFKKPIFINLWDCIINNNKPDSPKSDAKDDTIDYFTKSFLYQLASRNKDKSHFARYINHRLSKNYGKISFAISSIWSVIGLLFCLIFLILFYCFKEKNFAIYLNSLFNSELRLSILYKLFLLISRAPYILFLPILILGYLSLSNNNILFSLWNSQGNIIPTDTDSFEIFKEIIHHINPVFYKKRLIVIEDLDRPEVSDVVCRLLQELYRFINLLPENKRKKFVFIVSLKSEASLKTKKPEDVLNLYSKIFDYTVWIRPIHFNNVREIVYSLLIQKFSKNRTNELINDLYWIMRGTELTVREIKDRLNETFLLHQSLVRKDDFDKIINYGKCASVVYLQRQYPEEYQQLIRNEDLFAELIKKSFYQSLQLNEEDIKKLITGVSPKKQFIKDFLDMIKRKDIENDYLMYFYNYPKNSYIMNFAERKIYDYLIHDNYEFDKDSEIELYIQICINTNNAHVIKKALQELNDLKKNLGKIFFYFKDLFIYINQEKEYQITLIESYTKLLTTEVNEKNNIECLCKILDFSCDKTIEKKYLQKSIEILIQLYKTQSIDLNAYRLLLFKTYPTRISSFYSLCKSSTTSLPIIDIMTLSQISSSKDLFNCLDFKKIPSGSITDYLKIISKLSFIDFKKQIVESLEQIPNITNYPSELYNILKLNAIFDSTLFNIIFKAYQKNDKKKIIEYVEQLSMEQMTNVELQQIDSLNTCDITNREFIEYLEQKKLFKSAFYSRLNLNYFENFDIDSEQLTQQLNEICSFINSEQPDYIYKIRNIYINKKRLNLISFIFMEPYSFINANEINQIYISDLKYVIDNKRVSLQNLQIITDYCNNKSLSGNDLFLLFETLFLNDQSDNCIKTKDIINTIFDNIDFNNCSFGSLTIDQQERIIEVLTPIIELKNPSTALEFLKKINCHIDDIDENIQNNISSESDDLFFKYIEVINSIKKPSDKVIDYIASKNLNISLDSEITKELFKRKKYTQYVIGKSLKENNIIYDEKIPLRNYYEAYSQSDRFFELAKTSSIIQKIHEAGIYDSSLTLEKLDPFKNLSRQSCYLIKLFFAILQTNEERKQYFTQIPDIKSYKECEKLISFLIQDQQLELFHNDFIFRDVVKDKLWEIDDEGNNRKRVLKTKFTKSLNNALIRKYGNTN